MKIDKLVSQLNEAVKKRQNVFATKHSRVGDADYPIKGVNREMYKDYVKLKKQAEKSGVDTAKIEKHPYFTKVVDPMSPHSRIYRGRIKGSNNLSYAFKPDLTWGKNSEMLGPKYREQGGHIYSFKTPEGKEGNVYIHHMEAHPHLQRKGIRTTSEIGFDIDGVGHKTGEEGHKSLSIFRTVLPAIRHHLKSHNPDRITFSSLSTDKEMQRTKSGDLRDTRKKLYDFLAKKLSKTHSIYTEHEKVEDQDWEPKRGDFSARRPYESYTHYFLDRKKKNEGSLLHAIKMLDRQRRQIRKKKINEGKEEEWDARYDELSDRGGLSHEQIVRQIGEKPSSPQPEQAPPTRTLTGIELLRQRAKKAAEIALKRKQSGD
jgi:hypothetical protein